MPNKNQDFATMLVAKMQELDNDSPRHTTTNKQQNATKGHTRIDRRATYSDHRPLSVSALMAIARYGNSSSARQQSQSIANYTGGDTEESRTAAKSAESRGISRRDGKHSEASQSIGTIDSLSSSLRASEKLKLLTIKKNLQNAIKKYQEIQSTNNEISYDTIYAGSDIITLSKEAQRIIRKK